MAFIYCKHEAPRQRWIDGWVGVVTWLIEADEEGVTEKAGGAMNESEMLLCFFF